MFYYKLKQLLDMHSKQFPIYVFPKQTQPGLRDMDGAKGERG
jgi:hypothetical protein